MPEERALNLAFSETMALRRRVGSRPVVGITGSYAKTSTKHLLVNGLCGQFNVVGNRASYNVVDGLLSTLRRVDQDTDVVVQELGASGPGSLDQLISSLLPTVGILTAIGDDHRTAFRSRAATLAEKFKLIRALPPAGTAILNLDDPLIADTVANVRTRLLTFGVHQAADFRATDIRDDWPQRLAFKLHHAGRQYDVQTSMLGRHSLVCVLAAIAAAHAVGAELDDFIARLAGVTSPARRMIEHVRSDGLVIIRDDAKAAGYMLDASLAFLARATARQRILVIGKLSDTRKLGRVIRRLARHCRELGVKLITVGVDGRLSLKFPDFGWHDGVGALESVLEVHDFLANSAGKGDVVLLKSSASAHLNRIILAEHRSVRCRATLCGSKRGCDACPELEKANPPSFRFD